GVTITAVSEATPAEEAGLRAGDLIVDFAGEPVSSIDDLHRLLTEDRIGQVTPIRLLRRGELRQLVVVPREVS
ncbi:MAG: PDZ domain-containing protein, partial [Vicinamibacterales bacterium]